MNKLRQRSGCGWCRATWVLLWLAWLAGGLPAPVGAHEFFSTCIQHGVHVAVGAKHIDVTVDLTFFEDWSARERAAMDRDGNGRITRVELEVYQKRWATELVQQVKMFIGGQELPFILLYDPEVDLLGNQTTDRAHHRLRLSLFVATPAGLHADDSLVIEDQLWPDAKVLPTLEAEGRDDCKLTTEISIATGTAVAPGAASRRFIFRCVKPPRAKVTPPIAAAKATSTLTADATPAHNRTQTPP